MRKSFCRKCWKCPNEKDAATQSKETNKQEIFSIWILATHLPGGLWGKAGEHSVQWLERQNRAFTQQTRFAILNSWKALDNVNNVMAEMQLNHAFCRNQLWMSKLDLTKVKVHQCMTAKCWLLARSPNTPPPQHLQSEGNHTQRITSQKRIILCIAVALILRALWTIRIQTHRPPARSLTSV